jgi:hypothetical protein
VIIVEEVQIQPRPPKDPFPFYGLVRRLHARVVDAHHRGFAKAKPGSTMTSIELKGEFGRPEAMVQLTFYDAVGRAAKRGERSRKLRSIARFKPFIVKRGRQVLTLRVPEQFKPDYVGLTVQEVVDRGEVQGSSRGQVTKAPVGKRSGGIVDIRDAGRLHTRKPAKRRPRG